MATKLSWELFEKKFGTWASRIKPGFDDGLLDLPYARAKEVSKRGRKCAPDADVVFRSLLETPYDSLKCVMLGLSPYHTEKEGVKVADGLLMGASNHPNYLPPSLGQFYNALEEEFNEGLCLECTRSNDVAYLATQGVLMFNISLITELFKAGSHIEEWKPFMEYFFSEIIGVTGVPIIALGNEAQKVEKWKAPMQWYFPLSHPASASYAQSTWTSNGTFRKVNKVIKDMNNDTINWLPTGAELSNLLCPF